VDTVAIAAGAAVGAPARYLLDRALGARRGILLVNLVGSAVAGLVVGADPGPRLLALLVVGFAGAFTTASTLAWQLLQAARPVRLLLLHVVPGLLLAAAGTAVGRAL
jgi:CrcB protein